MCLPSPKAPAIAAPPPPPPPLAPMTSPEDTMMGDKNTAAQRASSKGRRALRIDLGAGPAGGSGLTIPS